MGIMSQEVFDAAAHITHHRDSSGRYSLIHSPVYSHDGLQYRSIMIQTQKQ